MERVIERGLTCGVDGIGLAVMQLVRSHQADAGMVVVLIAPIEEEESGALGIGHAPANHAAAEDVEDDIEIEGAPFGGPMSLVMSQDQTSFGPSASSSGF